MEIHLTKPCLCSIVNFQRVNLRKFIVFFVLIFMYTRIVKRLFCEIQLNGVSLCLFYVHLNTIADIIDVTIAQLTHVYILILAGLF